MNKQTGRKQYFNATNDEYMTRIVFGHKKIQVKIFSNNQKINEMNQHQKGTQFLDTHTYKI
jgi:DNA-binding transcriptional regulator GbsR (MarR family)